MYCTLQASMRQHNLSKICSADGRVWRENMRQELVGLDMYGGKMMGILGEGCENRAARKVESGRLNRRFMDAVREDMAVVEEMKEDAEDRNKWR